MGFEENGENIVLSGISGRFPRSNNMREFAHNLYNKVDMVDDSESRWKHFHPEVPKRSGKINNLDKFDASFFSIHNRLANFTDPQARILLEHSYEAILDAGVSPQSLIGSRTGVFIGCSYSDSKDAFSFKIPTRDGHAITGNAPFYLANRVSYALGLNGPSFVIDTACSSSAYALDIACKYIQSGACDAALIGGSQVTNNLISTTEFNRLRILASDGVCRPFDKNASGFTRADTIAMVFLQKRKDTKRIYANVVYVNSNNDGFKQEGSSFPSRILQQQLFDECFFDLKMNPNSVGYVEAHSTGTYFGDAEEVAAIDGAFCKDRPKPLPIGSVKSNMGHAEASSAIASIAKLILVLENRMVPPNINLKELRSNIPAFAEGRIRVVTEAEDFDGPYASLNSFGLGGANAHALFKGNLKSKINNGIPNDNLSRLICWSGRTEAALNSIFADITSRPLDGEHVALLQGTQVKTTVSNTYRGFGIFRHDRATGKAVCEQRNIHHYNSTKRPIVWIFSGIGSQWLEMGSDLMKIPIFAQTIDQCHKILVPRGVHLKNVITSNNKNNFDNVLKSYVGIVAIEIALTNILKAIGIEPDFIIGHSVGELAVAYADGCLTLEETILAAYARGRANNDSKTILGGMAAVGINHTELRNILPKDIDIACHNASDSTTISGPAESVTAFVKELESQNIFAKEIACSGVPLHSRYIKEMGSMLKVKLDDIIRNPKKRSAKWLSTTYPADQWDNEETQYSSAEYQTTNLLNPVHFHEVVEKLPTNALTIEISPHGLLKPILKRSMKEGLHFSLTQRDNKNGALLLMDTLGQIFQNGIDFDASKLYPAIEFPVSRGTPMISPVIEWDHSEDHFVPKFTGDWFEQRNVVINVNDKEYEYIQGHVIDGKILFPGTGLLTLVWQTFAMMQCVPCEKLPVTFEDVRFLRATNLMKNQDVILSISVNRGSGNFEITEGQSTVVQGNIKVNEDAKMTPVYQPETFDSIKLLDEDFYKEMRLRGYYHHGLFRAVVEATVTDFGFQGKIQWSNKWTTFIDCLMQFLVLGRDIRQLVLPTKFRKLVINPEVHLKTVSESKDGIVEAVYCPYTRMIQAGGIEIHDFEGSAVARRGAIVDPVLEVQTFLPHFPATPMLSKIDAAKFCVQLLLENTPTSRIISIEIDSNDGKESLSEFIFRGLSDLPTITSDMNYLSTKKDLDLDNVTVHDSDLSEFQNANFIVKSQCLNDEEFLKNAKSSLAEGGFIISREPQDKKLPIKVPLNLQLVATVSSEDELFFLLQVIKEDFKMPDSVIKISDKLEEWLEPLKVALNKGSVLAFSQNDQLSGILGLVNCIRREQPNLRCVFIDDPTAPAFDVNNPFYQLQLRLGLVNNVYKNNQWGSFRHLRLNQSIETKPRTDHIYANVQVNGDMSSLAWFDGPYNVDDVCNYPECIRVQYSAINFRDVMQATGKISFDFLNRLQLQCVLGFEFSGVTNNGKRIFGFGKAGSFATFYNPTDVIMWEAPENLTLQEAATIPLVYSTVYLAFFSEVKIQRGESVLIHAGSGGIGIAALHVAFHYGLEVFTTVSTQEKRNFLLERFPLLKPENIGNSRDTSFEDMVMVQTKGKGVDYVLNSLAQEKLLASIRCVAEDGTFIEIGKFDIMNKTKIDMGFCAKRINIKTVFLQATDGNVRMQDEIVSMMSEDLAAGIIKPLPSTVYEASEIQQAFRFLASGKHIGKILVKLRKHENDLESFPIAVLPRVFCNPRSSYIIIGGLGGFGLELADWLFLRGCKKIVFSSSRGITNGYQESRIKVWKPYGVEVIVNTSDVATRSGCEILINEALKLGPVGGIFNLAVVLRDGLYENQTVKLFEESFGPKAVATKYMDELSRKLCPDLKHFVVFSSVSCGRGNAGQSNYGMANSIMERVIERRHELKLPAKAIQWGAVGDVGLLANLQLKNMDMQISGTLPQRITSCLEVLDTLLLSEMAVVSSMIVAEKHFSDFKKDNIIEALCNILGIRDKKTISMDSPLSKLGMDSLMTIEITQLLEREFNLALPLKELQSMTLYELEQRTKSKDSIAKDNDTRKQLGLELILRGISREQKSDDTIVDLNGKKGNGCKTLIIPGIEGTSAAVWDKLAGNLNSPTYLLQTNKTFHANNLKEIHDCVIQDVLDLYSKDKNFVIVGYSFGALISLEIAKTLESKGMTGNVILIDGSPLYFSKYAEQITKSVSSNESGQNEILSVLIRIDFPTDNSEVLRNIFLAPDWDSKLEVFMKFHELNLNSKKQYSKDFISAILKRFKMMEGMDLSLFSHIKVSKLSLVKPTRKLVMDVDEFYGLNNYSESEVEAITIDANHISVLDSEELFTFINKIK